MLNENLIVVQHKRSGKQYTLERDVLEANINEPRPYVYVWPVKPPRGRRAGQPVWCFLSSLEPLRTGDFK